MFNLFQKLIDSLSIDLNFLNRQNSPLHKNKQSSVNGDNVGRDKIINIGIKLDSAKAENNIEKARLLFNEIFDVPNASEAETSFFKGKSHDSLLDVFSSWFRLAVRLRGVIPNILNLQGLHDRGIDLIMEFSGEINLRVGIQVKCDNDFDKNLNTQVDNTLANYDTYNIDYVIFIFCGDYTNLSHKTKIRQEIARIEQKKGIDKIFIIEAPKAVTLLGALMPISSYLEQFKVLPDSSKFKMRIIGSQEDESGFPIVQIESESFTKGYESIGLAKAYLSTILGLVNPDILELGFFEDHRLIIGTCPMDKVFKSIRISDQISIKIPMWFMRGLEEHSFLSFWGSSMHEGGRILELMLQFQITNADFEKNKHYQFVKNKFNIIIDRLSRLGEISIVPLNVPSEEGQNQC